MTALEIPAVLRRWFVIHAAIDLIVAVPLLVAPESFLHSLGWAAVDPPSARLVGAALLAIGGQSWLGRHGDAEAYRAMLNLKLIWSGAAIVGLAASLGDPRTPGAVWVFLALFLAFFGIWFYYRVRMKQIGRMSELDDDAEQSPNGAGPN